jgi:RNA polymerase sigma-70 factor (ECF subfamily)
VFPTTRQTLLRQAAPLLAESAASDEFSAAYWKPCRRYLEWRFRMSIDAAEDAAQSFFEMLVERNLLERYDSTRGGFRSYLRGCLDQFGLKQNERARAQKRGGAAASVPLDENIPASDEIPDVIFEREWKRQIFELALADLENLSSESGREIRFQIFAAYDLAEEPRPSYRELGARFDVETTTVTNHLAWARRELRRLLELRLKQGDMRALLES